MSQSDAPPAPSILVNLTGSMFTLGQTALGWLLDGFAQLDDTARLLLYARLSKGESILGLAWIGPLGKLSQGHVAGYSGPIPSIGKHGNAIAFRGRIFPAIAGGEVSRDLGPERLPLPSMSIAIEFENTKIPLGSLPELAFAWMAQHAHILFQP